MIYMYFAYKNDAIAFFENLTRKTLFFFSFTPFLLSYFYDKVL